MNLVHFIHRYPPAPGGSEKYAAELAHFLTQCGDHVQTWTSTADDLEAMRYTGYREFHESRSGPVRRYRPLHFPGRRYALKALSLCGSPAWEARWAPCNPIMPRMHSDALAFDGPLDAVHAFAFPHSFLAYCAWRLARKRHVPLLLTPFLHLGDPLDTKDRTRQQYTSRPLRWLLRQADLVFTQTPTEHAKCIELGVPPERVVLQGLGIDPAECTGGDRQAARRRWGLQDKDFVVGHLANLSQEKGTIDLLEATRGSRMKIVLAGSSMPNFDRYWAKHHRENVVLLGRITDEEKRDFYAALDAFALPSRSDSFGLVLLEAWANCLPVVAYRAGGPADLVEHEVDGLLSFDLRDALEKLRTQPETRSRLGANGRNKVLHHHLRDEQLAIVRDNAMSLLLRRSHAPA
ncbi:MAG: glycosyltransferase family 4 protein [Fimbriiglobus sp.]